LWGHSAIAGQAEKPADLVEPTHADGRSRTLPLLQVFHAGLLFLTFLPGSARWSAASNQGSDPSFEHRHRDFLESSLSTWLTVAQPRETQEILEFFPEVQLAGSGGGLLNDRLESKDSFRSSARRPVSNHTSHRDLIVWHSSC
jgi:hypothetical protein